MTASRLADPLADPRLSDAAVVVALCTAGVAMLHWTLVLMPKCFTLGEAAVVSQALLLVVSLTLYDAVYGHLPLPSAASPTSAGPAAMNSCCSGLPSVSMYCGKLRREECALHAAAHAVDRFVLRLITSVSVLAMGLAAVCRAAPLRRSAASTMGAQQPAWSSTASHRTLYLEVLSWLTAAAGMMAAAAGGWVLVDLALWVLTHFLPAALAPRLAILAYWSVLLAVALPLLLRSLQQPEGAPAETKAGHLCHAGVRDTAVLALPATGPAGSAPVQTCSESAVRQRSKVGTAVGSASNAGSTSSLDRLDAGVRDATTVASSPGSDSTRSACVDKQGLVGANATVPPSHCLPGSWRVPHIIVRKGYHLLALALFLPVEACDADMLQVSVAIALAVLVAVEVLRCTRLVPPLSAAIQQFMQGFVDHRDAGPVYITHFTLLLGMAGPLWLRGAVSHTGLHGQRLFGVSGMVALGLGDTAASAVGYLWGTHRIFAGSSKTWEGTTACAVAMLLGWGLLIAAPALSGWTSQSAAVVRSGGTGWGWVKLVLSTCGAAGLEASTHQLDNLVVPIYYGAWLLMMS